MRALLTAFLAGSLAVAPAGARVTGTNPTGASADSFCSGKSGAEACIDASGNVIPTTANTQSLGTSALPYSAVFAASQTSAGTATIGTAGAGTASTTTTQGAAATLSTSNGITVFAESAVSNIVLNSTIPVNSSYLVLLSTGGSVKLTSTPSISTTTVIAGSTLLPSGTYLILSSTATANDVVLQSSGTLTGSGLVLGATTRTITRHKVLVLILDTRQVPALWREVSYGNN